MFDILSVDGYGIELGSEMRERKRQGRKGVGQGENIQRIFVVKVWDKVVDKCGW